MKKLIHALWRRVCIVHQTIVSLYYFECRNLAFYIYPRPHIQIMTAKRVLFGNWNYFRWLRKNHPEHFARLRFTRARAPFSEKMEKAEALFNWIATPHQFQSEKTRAFLVHTEAAFEQENLKIINRIEAIENTIKARALDLIASTGILTGKTISCDEKSAFKELEATLGTPFLIRSNTKHSAPIHRICNSHEFNTINWKRITDPAASRYIETRGEDGYYRKYRYVLFGDSGINRHLILSEQWWQHASNRLNDDQQKIEEQAFFKIPPPFHEELNQARLALGLDYVAFDYSINPEGKLVVWEPNALPVIWILNLNYSGPDDYCLQQAEKVYSFISRILFSDS